MGIALEIIRDRLINGIITIPIWADWQYGIILIFFYSLIAFIVGF